MMSQKDSLRESQRHFGERDVARSEAERRGLAGKRDKRTGEPLDSEQSTMQLDVGARLSLVSRELELARDSRHQLFNSIVVWVWVWLASTFIRIFITCYKSCYTAAFGVYRVSVLPT